MVPMLDSLWGAIVLIGSFLLVLGAVVFIHEFGHFFVARRCGVKVEVFSIGMGPEVVGRSDRRGARMKSRQPSRSQRQGASSDSWAQGTTKGRSSSGCN